MNVNTNKRRVKQYDSLADLYADREKQRAVQARSHHNSVRYTNRNVKDLKPEDFNAKYADRRRAGKTDRERRSGEAAQRYQNRVNRSEYNKKSLTNKNDSVAGRDEASQLFREYCGSCNGKRTRAIRKAAA